MSRFSFIIVLIVISACASLDKPPAEQANYERIMVSGVDVTPASQTSKLYVGMPEQDVYKILGMQSRQMDSFMLFFDLYEPKFIDRTVPHYVVLDQHRHVKYWGSSGSPEKDVDIREFDY